MVDSFNNRRHDIKAGWYEGQLYENNGLRHGHEITHHDDGTRYEGPYFRLFNGRLTSVRVSEEYGAWIVQCMGAVYPGLPAVDDTMMMAMMRPSAGLEVGHCIERTDVLREQKGRSVKRRRMT